MKYKQITEKFGNFDAVVINIHVKSRNPDLEKCGKTLKKPGKNLVVLYNEKSGNHA